MPSDLRDDLQTSLGTAYSLERELGGGGMSRVFLAEEVRLRRKVVVKVLAPELAAGINAERFEREIQLAASLQQANIVPVLSAGETGGSPYYTMPFVEGESLRSRLGRDGRLPMSAIIGILRDVSRALAYAHERGVVHRDIKPDNILLSGGTAVVTDFGIAKALSASREPAPNATLTQLGTSLGTPAYMAPEQAAGDPDTDHRADIYALGCTAYELLTGRVVFPDRTPQRMLAAHLAEQPQPVSELRPDAPPALAELVMRSLAKDPAARPQSADELVRALESVSATGSSPAMDALPFGGPRVMRSALLLYAVSFAAVAILARAAVMVLGLPDWVFSGALVVMALGFPVILLTGYAHHAARRSALAPSARTSGGTAVPASGVAGLAAKAGAFFTWRRVAMGGAGALIFFALLVGGFMLSRALGIGPAASLFAAGKLHEKDRVLVADFRAVGADSSVGHIASEAVRIELGQSAAVSVVPTNAIASALQRMRRAPNSRVDLALAREIAAREGIKAILHGEVTPLGGGFVIIMRLIAAESGDELAVFRETADSPRELIPTLERLSRRLRGKMGESLKAVRASPALADVTTPSLEALRKYAAGARAMDLETNYQAAIGLLEEATALDTAFAMAYRKLGLAYRNAGYPLARIDTPLIRAYRFRDRLTERERLLTTATYFGSGPGRDRARAVAAYEALLEIDPENGAALNNVGLLYRSRREWAKAEAVYRRAAASENATVIAFGNLRQTLFNQGKMAAMDSVAAEQRRRFPGVWSEPIYELPPMYQRGQLDSVSAALQRLRGSSNPAVRAAALEGLADYETIRGRLAESMRVTAEARTVSAARGVDIPVLFDSMAEASFDIWQRGQPERGVRRMEAALAGAQLSEMPPTQRPYFWAAQLYALADRPDRARAMLARYDAEVRDTVLRRELQTARHHVLGAIALSESRPADAITELRLADNYPDGPSRECAICLDAILGIAFDAAEMPDSAIAAFERYVGTPYWGRASRNIDGTWLAFVSHRLGELYEAKGERAKAAAYFSKFIELWKNADPDLQPKVAEAKRRLERVRDVERR